MNKKLLFLPVFVLIALSLGCIGQQSTSPATVTNTVEKYYTTTITTTHQTTKTEFLTTTQFVPTTMTVTTTITNEVTVTITVYGLQQSQKEAKTYNVKVSIVDGPFSAKENGTTRTLYVPSSWTPIANDLYNIYRFLDPGYLSSFSREVEIQLGISTIPTVRDPRSYEQIASIIYFSFDYDYYRSEHAPATSYLPDQLLTEHSGICGDFALFYAALLLAHDKTVTYYILSFDNGEGHAMIEYDNIIWENQYVGEDPKYAFNYWLKENGPFKLYAIVIYPHGYISVSSTTITEMFPVPVTPAFITSKLHITGTLTYTYSNVIVTEVDSIILYQDIGSAITSFIVNGKTRIISYIYNYPTISYRSYTYSTIIYLSSTDDPLRFYYMAPDYVPRYQPFYAKQNTIYMFYWNTDNEPVFYTVIAYNSTLYVKYSDTEITGTGVVTLLP